MDLKTLSRQANTSLFPTIEELRALPILYVFERANVAYEERDGVYTAKNPFRYDANPSFDVFGEKLERWGDFAEGSGGDVIDLLQRFAPELRFVDVKDWAARLLRECKESGWSGPTTGGGRRAFDLGKARAYVDNVLSGFDAHEPLFDFLTGRDDYLTEISCNWLIEHFRIGWDGDRLVIPYLDRGGALRWYKTRRLDGPVRAACGAGYDTLFYGEHLDTDPARTVVLCEGESDVWSGTHAAGGEYVFLGLPTGAGSAPTLLAPRLTGRRVILAFDGDPAGRAATCTWMAALWAQGTETHSAHIPNHRDLTSADPAETWAALERVRFT
jgi:hypothetical protein